VPRGHPFDPLKQETALELLREGGITQAEASRLAGVSRTAVHFWVADAGIDVPAARKRWLDEQWTLTVQVTKQPARSSLKQKKAITLVLLKAGKMTQAEASRLADVSEPTVYGWVMDAAIDLAAARGSWLGEQWAKAARRVRSHMNSVALDRAHRGLDKIWTDLKVRPLRG
jgi:predicted HTH domain antitoxin